MMPGESSRSRRAALRGVLKKLRGCIAASPNVPSKCSNEAYLFFLAFFFAGILFSSHSYSNVRQQTAGGARCQFQCIVTDSVLVKKKVMPSSEATSTISSSFSQCDSLRDDHVERFASKSTKTRTGVYVPVADNIGKAMASSPRRSAAIGNCIIIRD
jgi:hypothetical protein